MAQQWAVESADTADNNVVRVCVTASVCAWIVFMTIWYDIIFFTCVDLFLKFFNIYMDLCIDFTATAAAN